MSNAQKESLPIQDLEIKISSESGIPHIILNGIDFQAENLGLKGLKIIWETKEDEIPETLIQVDYIKSDDIVGFQETTISQSFRGSLLSK